MISQILHQLDKTAELLQYFGGAQIATTTVGAVYTYTGTALNSGLPVGDKVLFAGFVQPNSNGVKTITGFVSTTGIIVAEPIGSDETLASGGTLNQEYQGGWVVVDRWAKLTGLFNCTGGSATVYVDQSGDGGTNADYTSSFTATTAVPLAFSVETVARHARLRVRNSGTDQTVLRGYLYGRAIS